MGFFAGICGKTNKRRKYEELLKEVKYLKQTSGTAIAVLECRVAQLQDQLDSILRQRARLWEEIRQLQEQCEMQRASSEPQPTSRQFAFSFR